MSHELRANGYRIACSREGQTVAGRRVFRYRIDGYRAEEAAS
jgi:hypothetical protein